MKIWLSHNGFETENDIRKIGAIVETPLHIAVRHNEYRMVKRLLWAGADPETVDHRNRTALDVAIYLDETDEDRKQIINLFMNVGSRSSDSLDSSLKQCKINEFLQKHGFESVDSCKTKKRFLRRDIVEYPLHHAVRIQSVDLVEALLWAGANTACLNHKGESPLFMAKNKPDGNIIRLLAVC
jgi:ankyrin repeat protein